MVDNNLPTNTEIDVNALPGNLPSVQNKSPKSTPTTDNSKNKMRIIIAVACIVLFVFGFLAGYQVVNLRKSETVKVVTQVSPEDKNFNLPESLQVLKNPSFTDWGARVKGKVVSANEKQIVIIPIKETFLPGGKRTIQVVDQNDQTVIYIVPKSTKFYLSSSAGSGGGGKEISFGEIPLGSIIEGSVQILYSENTVSLYGKSLSMRN